MDGSKSTDTTAPIAATADAAVAAERESGPEAGERVANPASPPTLNEIRYPCLMNMDYHAAREARLDRNHRWLMFGVIIAGASAFLDIWEGMRVIGPVVAVLAGSLDLTFDLSNRARSHAMFRRRYAEILAEASRSPDKLTELQCKLDELSGEEEPPYHAQMALSAMRAQEQAYGKVTDPCRPGWFYRLFANVVRFDGKDFNEVKPLVANNPSTGG